MFAVLWEVGWKTPEQFIDWARNVEHSCSANASEARSLGYTVRHCLKNTQGTYTCSLKGFVPEVTWISWQGSLGNWPGLQPELPSSFIVGRVRKSQTCHTAEPAPWSRAVDWIGGTKWLVVQSFIYTMIYYKCKKLSLFWIFIFKLVLVLDSRSFNK